MAKLKPPAQSQGAIINLATPPLRKSTEKLQAYKSWPYTSVNAIAQEVSGIKLHLFKRKIVRGKVEVEEVTEHEALSLLHSVNDFYTSFQLWEITQIYLELLGEAYWVLLRSDPGNINSPIEQIWPLRPDWVSVIPSDNFIDAYSYSPGGMYDPNAVRINLIDIIQFKNPNPINPYRGKGTVEAAAMAIDTDEFSAEWNRNFFYNSAVPYLILRTKKKPTEQEMRRFVETWQAKFQGRVNSHKIAMLTGDWEDPFVFGDKFKDMDFIEQRKMMRDEVLGIWRVPKSVIGITEDVNRANADATIRSFMERTITPKMVRLVSHLNEFYLRNWPNEDLFFDFDDPAPEDVELNLKIYDSGKNYWLTPNEIRARENLPPLKGGDSIYMPLTMTPVLENVGNKIKSWFGKSTDDEKGVIVLEAETNSKGEIIRPQRKWMMPIPPRRLSSLRREMLKDELKKDLMPDFLKLVRNLMSEDGGEVSGRRLPWSQEQREAHWLKMVAKTDVQETSFKEKIIILFEEQEAEVIRNIENTLKYMVSERRKGKESSFLFNMADENRKWQSILGPMIKEIVLDRGAEILELLGIPAQLDLSQKTAALFLSKLGVVFIKEVNQTTRDELRETLKDGLIKEEGIPELSKRVRDIFEFATKSRSEMIARTEVLRSTNFATLEAFRQSRVVEGKEWLTAKDERVDPLCAALDGKVISTNGAFEEGGFSGLYPPLHPNCRCTILPVLVGQGKSSKKEEVKKEPVDEKILETSREVLEQAQEIITEAKKDITSEKEDMEKELEVKKQEITEERNRLLKEAEEQKNAIIEEAKKVLKKVKEVING